MTSEISQWAKIILGPLSKIKTSKDSEWSNSHYYLPPKVHSSADDTFCIVDYDYIDVCC